MSAYRGTCGACGTEHSLPRTPAAREAAHRLMRRLAHDPRFGREGKMFGVLVGRTPDGGAGRLEAFSGMLDGRPFADGFVGPTRPGRLTAEAESATLAQLTALGSAIATIDVDGVRAALARARRRFDAEILALTNERRRQKRFRAVQRLALSTAGNDRARWRELEAISQREGGRLRALRRERRQALEPLERTLDERLEQRAKLRAQRRTSSRALQARMHASHGLVNFAGRYATLEQFFEGGRIPTGTGECCAPKLLHEAALRGIRPTGLAEFWWGPPPPGAGRTHERFYPPCEDKCGPILGHLLCGLESPCPPLAILHEDEDLIAVAKPAGLLSVPGRTSENADCVEARLGWLRPRETFLRATHRLDQGTSGVLLFARSEEAHRSLSSAFARGDVIKEYRARVAGRVRDPIGTIRLPLRADLRDRPRQIVDLVRGRNAQTHFEVLAHDTSTTDLRLRPTTGRTHQLRVHCAHRDGLGAPIVGDGLYGTGEDGARLHLHAALLRVPHPRDARALDLRAPLPAELA